LVVEIVKVPPIFVSHIVMYGDLVSKFYRVAICIETMRHCLYWFFDVLATVISVGIAAEMAI